MPLNIKDADTHALAKRLASLTGESLTKAVKHAIQAKLAQVEKRKVQPHLPMSWITLPCSALSCRGVTSGVPIGSSVMTKAVCLRDGGRYIGTHCHHGR